MRWTVSSHHFALRHFFAASGLLLGLTGFSQLAFGYHYHGRASIGAYNATEKYKDNELTNLPTDSFDVRTISSRFFYEGTDFWNPAAENNFTVDLRDKHDFFDKDDKEKLELTDRNSFQVRTLSLRTRPQGEKIALQIGRFAIPSAGAVFTDGIHVAYRANEAHQFGVFGGYDPRDIDKSYLEFNQDARDVGIYYHFEPKYPTWDRRLLADQAVVRETLNNETLRTYLYQNTFYQWRPANYITSLLYLDFEPKTYLQNGTISGQRAWHRFTGSMTLMRIDTIEYNRHQDILEDLDPSPYSEASLGGRYKITEKKMPYMKVRYGKRDADHLDRTNVALGLDLPQYFSDFVDIYGQVSVKDEFTKKGTFGKVGIGYYRDVWQTDISVEAGTETDSNRDGDKLSTLVLDLDSGRNFRRDFFGAFGLQLAQNDDVNIFAVYFKLTYKFGQAQTAPMRDEAPLRGHF